MSFNGTKNKRFGPPAHHRQDIINLSRKASALPSPQPAPRSVRQITDLSRALSGTLIRLVFSFYLFFGATVPCQEALVSLHRGRAGGGRERPGKSLAALVRRNSRPGVTGRLQARCRAPGVPAEAEGAHPKA